MCMYVYTYKNTHLNKPIPQGSLLLVSCSQEACYSTSAQQGGFLQKSHLSSNPGLNLEALQHRTQEACF